VRQVHITNIVCILNLLSLNNTLVTHHHLVTRYRPLVTRPAHVSYFPIHHQGFVQGSEILENALVVFDRVRHVRHSAHLADAAIGKEIGQSYTSF